MDTGLDTHLLTSDLDFTISNDIEREKTVYSWRGYRHMFGLKVRGQYTTTSGRKAGAVGGKKLPKPGLPVHLALPQKKRLLRAEQVHQKLRLKKWSHQNSRGLEWEIQKNLKKVIGVRDVSGPRIRLSSELVCSWFLWPEK